MPKSIGVIVAKLLNTIACLCRGEGPNCLSADFSSVLVVDRRSGVVDVG